MYDYRGFGKSGAKVDRRGMIDDVKAVSPPTSITSESACAKPASGDNLTLPNRRQTENQPPDRRCIETHGLHKRLTVTRLNL
jgi:hypothetical protein